MATMDNISDMTKQSFFSLLLQLLPDRGPFWRRTSAVQVTVFQTISQVQMLPKTSFWFNESWRQKLKVECVIQLWPGALRKYIMEAYITDLTDIPPRSVIKSSHFDLVYTIYWPISGVTKLTFVGLIMNQVEEAANWRTFNLPSNNCCQAKETNQRIWRNLHLSTK